MIYQCLLPFAVDIVCVSNYHLLIGSVAIHIGGVLHEEAHVVQHLVP